jgi:Na+-transporting methylmalonyl-CoA/oxaloacetate decarboxylase gamma subunit
MIKSILTHIGGIEHYGIISMCLFVFVFLGMLIWVCCLKSAHVNKMAAAPLENETEAPTSETNHE